MRFKALTALTAAAVMFSLAAAARAAGTPRQWNGHAVPSSEDPSISAEWFQRLHKAVAPQGELWAEIPWETDLAAARRRAAKEGKPLFMWIMDGHPLGCT